ncbi:MAG: hypothetical protein ACK55Z_12660, partial [bacterium]
NRILHQLTESDCQEHKESLYRSIVRPARMRSSVPLLEPGPPRFFWWYKTANKPHASRKYTQDQLSVHTAAEN